MMLASSISPPPPQSSSSAEYRNVAVFTRRGLVTVKAAAACETLGISKADLCEKDISEFPVDLKF